jgi:isoleucyl-tRNA synthetase
LADFDPAKDTVASEDMEEIDRWAMMQANRLLAKATDAFDRYQFHEAYREIYGFCSTEMSSFYLDVMKDRLYTYLPDSRERRSAQTAMNGILAIMTKVIAPVLCFTSEEIWMILPDQMKDAESVHLSAWPAADTRFEDAAMEEKWAELIRVRDDVLKVLEVARNEKRIGNALEAKVELYPKGDLKTLLEQNRVMLPMLFIVSQAEVLDNDAPDDAAPAQSTKDLSIRVVPAEGEKCQRCWNYNPGVGSDAEHPALCPRCAETVKRWPLNPV